MRYLEAHHGGVCVKNTDDPGMFTHVMFWDLSADEVEEAIGRAWGIMK